MRFVALALGLLVSFGADIARAESQSERTLVLSFEQAVAAVSNHPSPKARLGAARRLRNSSENSPVLDAQPSVTLLAGARVAPSSERGPEVQVSVTQSLSLRGAAARRRESLAAEAGAQSTIGEAEMFSLKEAVAARWLDLWTAEHLLRSATDEASAVCEMGSLIERRRAAGEQTAADVTAALVECSRADQLRRDASGALVEAQLGLLGELGIEAETLATTGTLPEFPKARLNESEALQRLKSLPQVRMHLAAARASAHRSRELDASLGPRITLGAQVQRDALGATAVLGMFGVPLPIVDTSLRERATEQAAQQIELALARATERRAKAEVRQRFHELEHWTKSEQQLRAVVLPLAERLVAQRMRQLEHGEASTLDLLDARRQLTLVTREHKQALARKTLAEAKLSLLLNSLEGHVP